MTYPLQNRLALITGGSSGIGFAIAEKLAANGIEVTIADVVPPSKIIPHITYKYCDVTKGEDVDKLFADMLPNLPNVLVLSAGKGIHERLTEGDPEKWKDVLDLNIMGLLRCIRAFVPAMQEKQNGNVVFISSVAANKPYAYGGVYTASKAAINSIAETLRMETMPHIAVSTVQAGITNTHFFKDRADKDSMMQHTGSLHAKDIADDVFYIISQPPGKTINTIITRPSGQEF